MDNDWLKILKFKALVEISWDDPSTNQAQWACHRIMNKLHDLKKKIKVWFVGERYKRLGQKMGIEKDILRLDRIEGGPEWSKEKRFERATRWFKSKLG